MSKYFDFKSIKINWREVIPFTLIIVCLGILLVYGNFKHEQKFNNCSEEVTGYLIDSSEKEYQYVGYMGGRVQTGYETYLLYGFDVDDITHTIGLKVYGRYEPPSVMLFRYNPDNPGEFYFNPSEIKGYEVNDWLYHNGHNQELAYPNYE